MHLAAVSSLTVCQVDGIDWLGRLLGVHGYIFQCHWHFQNSVFSVGILFIIKGRWYCFHLASWLMLK